jgi:hypothetical protein
MGQFAAQLAETSSSWRKAVAPYAELAAKIFWQGRSKRPKFNFLPTRLTQTKRSQAKAGNLVSNVPEIPRTKPRCPICGSGVSTRSIYCANCTPLINRQAMLEKAKLGRIATHTPIAEARRSATQAKQHQALRDWNPSALPTWLDEDTYRQKILPRLAKFTVKAVRLSIDVSHPYAVLIKRGERIPHPRHWLALSDLTGYNQ